MPDQLTTPQLEAIQRLIIQPLLDAVRVEMQAGHERLAAAIEKVADRLAAHVADETSRDRARDGRIETLERRVGALERFRGRVLVVYGVLTMLLSFAWSLLRDWLVEPGRRR